MPYCKPHYVKDQSRSFPERVLLERKRPPSSACEMVADGGLVATVADEAVDVRDDADIEEVVAQVGVGDATALAAEPGAISAASSCRSDPWLTLT
jgi:hypothetical protein